jgi:hypothetical protein
MRELAAWGKHLLISLVAALLVGGLAYSAARAATSAHLLYQQRQLVEQTAAVMRGGDITALAGSGNLREMRREGEERAARYHRLCIQAGIAAATLTALVTYLWIERQHRASDSLPPYPTNMV